MEKTGITLNGEPGNDEYQWWSDPKEIDLAVASFGQRLQYPVADGDGIQRHCQWRKSDETGPGKANQRTVRAMSLKKMNPRWFAR